MRPQVVSPGEANSAKTVSSHPSSFPESRVRKPRPEAPGNGSIPHRSRRVTPRSIRLTFRSTRPPALNHAGAISYTYGSFDDTYGANPFVGGTLTVSGQSLSVFQDSSRVLLVGDGLCRWFHSNWISQYQEGPQPHNGGYNIAYVDGHVKWHGADFTAEEFQVH